MKHTSEVNSTVSFLKLNNMTTRKGKLNSVAGILFTLNDVSSERVESGEGTAPEILAVEGRGGIQD